MLGSNVTLQRMTNRAAIAHERRLIPSVDWVPASVRHAISRLWHTVSICAAASDGDGLSPEAIGVVLAAGTAIRLAAGPSRWASCRPARPGLDIFAGTWLLAPSYRCLIAGRRAGAPCRRERGCASFNFSKIWRAIGPRDGAPLPRWSGGYQRPRHEAVIATKPHVLQAVRRPGRVGQLLNYFDLGKKRSRPPRIRAREAPPLTGFQVVKFATCEKASSARESGVGLAAVRTPANI